MQDRRNFLKHLTMLSTCTWAPSFLVRSVKAAKASGMARAAMGNPNRILVVVEMAGGCDGLNTLVPYTNDAYYQARSSLAIRENQGLLKLNNPLGEALAFHPSMTGFRDLWEAGNLSVVQGVGYPNPNRSHFRSRDIWHTAEPENVASDGWLANYLDENPSEATLEALNIGGRVPRALVGESGSSPSIQSIDTYQLQTDPKFRATDEANKNAAFQQILSEPHNQYPLEEYVKQTLLDATLSSIQLLDGQDNYQSSIEYPNGAFANNLRSIAQIIAAEIGITVFYTTIGGFDNHSGQIQAGNNLLGVHSNLLEDVSSGLGSFYSDLVEMGREQDVLILTFSEFGRRLRQNGSLGTDHGTANQMFLLGGGLTPQEIYGEHPSLADDDLDIIGDMVYTLDFRSVYAAVLADWLGADPAVVLGTDFLDFRIRL